MTRVLHLITRFLDGGAETTTKNAIEALLESEEEYDVRLGVGADYDPDRLEGVGGETTVFQTIRHYNPFSALVAVFAVAWYLRREDINVVHTHSTEAGIIGRLAGTLARTPVVIHEIHGDPITDDRNLLLNQLLLSMERLAAPLADRLIVKSEVIRDTFLKRGIGKPSQYDLIYHGVDIDQFQAAMTGHPKEGPLKLVFVGRLVEGKGLLDLLSAIEELDDVELDIVGEGPLYDDLNVKVQECRLTEISLLGYREDIPNLLAEAGLLVLPSYREGTPRAITEAMAAGLPIVATDIAGVPEQVTHGKTGYLVTPGDVDGLVEAIRCLAENPSTREEFGKRARDKVDRFDVRTAKSKYRQLYHETIRDNRDPLSDL